MLGAAAAIVVVFAGGIALQTLSGSDSTDEASFSAATVATTAEPSAALADANDAAGGEQASTDAKAQAPEVASAETPGSPADGTVDTGIADPAPPGELELEELSTSEELGIFASDAVDAPTTPDVPAATSAPVDDRLTETQAAVLDAELPLCLNVDYVVGPALYQGTEVVVGVDTSRDLALAYRAVNCREVARAPLP
jgi:hypothetical protein